LISKSHFRNLLLKESKIENLFNANQAEDNDKNHYWKVKSCRL